MPQNYPENNKEGGFSYLVIHCYTQLIRPPRGTWNLLGTFISQGIQAVFYDSLKMGYQKKRKKENRQMLAIGKEGVFFRRLLWESCRILAPQPGIEPVPPAVES